MAFRHFKRGAVEGFGQGLLNVDKDIRQRSLEEWRMEREMANKQIARQWKREDYIWEADERFKREKDQADWRREDASKTSAAQARARLAEEEEAGRRPTSLVDGDDVEKVFEGLQNTALGLFDESITKYTKNKHFPSSRGGGTPNTSEAGAGVPQAPGQFGEAFEQKEAYDFDTIVEKLGDAVANADSREAENKYEQLLAVVDRLREAHLGGNSRAEVRSLEETARKLMRELSSILGMGKSKPSGGTGYDKDGNVIKVRVKQPAENG